VIHSTKYSTHGIVFPLQQTTISALRERESEDSDVCTNSHYINHVLRPGVFDTSSVYVKVSYWKSQWQKGLTGSRWLRWYLDKNLYLTDSEIELCNTPVEIKAGYFCSQKPHKE